MTLKTTLLTKVLNVILSLVIVISQVFLSFNKPLFVYGLDANVFLQTTAGDVSYYNQTVYVDSAIDVDLKTTAVHSSGLVYGATVKINNYVSGDVLGVYGYTLPSSNISYSAGTLTFAQKYTETEIENLLRKVTFTANASNTDVTTRSITFEIGTANKSNGHYYEFVNNGAIIYYASSFSGAAAKKHFGVTGYLVSPNSATENDFLRSTFNNTAYFSPTTYYWIGIDNKINSSTAQYSSGPLDNTAVTYFNWGPNGEGTSLEPLVVINTAAGTWHDVWVDNANMYGYGIEYGGMVGDPTPITSASKSITFPTWSINYDSNGSSSGSTPSILNVRQDSTASTTISSNSGNLVKTGYSFLGWNTSADGTGKFYQANANTTISGSLTLYAQWIKVTANATPLSFAQGQGATTVDSSLEVSGFRLKQVLVSIEGYQSGDVLSFDNLNGLTLTTLSSVSTMANKYLLSSSTYQDASIYQTALRSMKFNTTSTVTGTRNIKITYSNNEHGYALTSTSTDWTTAKTNAEAINSLTQVGTSKQSYLVTITSQIENDIVYLLSGNSLSRWIGLYSVSGTWKWNAGPELGTTPSTYGFSGWVTGQPDNSGPTGSFWGSSGGWDDLASSSVTSIVEYGEQVASFSSFQRDVIITSQSITLVQSSSTTTSSTITIGGLDSTKTSLKYAVVKHGDPVPSSSELYNGIYSSGANFVKSGTATTSGTSYSLTISSLPENFLLDVYAIQLSGTSIVNTTLTYEAIYASTIRVAYDFNSNVDDVTGRKASLVAYNKYTNTADVGYTTSADGIVQNAYRFDGTRAFTLPNNIIQNGTNTRNPFTVSFYFKTTSTLGVGLLGYNGGTTIYSASGITGYIPILTITPDGKLHSILWKGNADLHVASSYAVNDGKWHKIILSAYPTPTNTATDTLDVYLDGVNIGNDSSGQLNHFNMNNVTLGTNYGQDRFTGSWYTYSNNLVNGWFKPFVGDIDELVIYDVGLNQTQVQATSLDVALEYVLNGGSFTSSPQYLYSKTATTAYTLPSPTRNGYTFLGWYTTTDFSGSVQTVVPVGTTSNQKFYAKWSRYITFAIPTFSSSYRYVTSLMVYSGTTDAAKLIEADGRLRINPALSSVTGGVFFGQKLTLPVDKSFSSHFSFKVTDGSNSADGFVYVLSSNQASTASLGGGLGYSGMGNSVAIVFDTFYNAGDPTPNSISLVVNGSLTPLVSYSGITDANFLNALRYIWVDYNGTTLSVYYGTTNVLANATKVIQYNINLNTYLTTDDIYVGFTGATGGSTQDNSIYSWYFDSRYETIEPASSTPLISDFTTISMTDPGTIGSSSTVTVSLTMPDGTAKQNETVTFAVDGVGTTQTQTTDSSGNTTFTVTNPNTFSSTTTKNVVIASADTSVTKTLQFKPYLSLTLNANGGSGTAVNLNGYPSTNVTLPSASTYSKTGYSLSSWNTLANGTGTSYALNSTYSLTANTSLYAIYSLATYTLTYNLDGGTNSGTNPSTYTYTTPTITLGSPIKTGYTFAGWYTASDFSGSAVSSIPLNSSGNKTYYAKFTVNSYTLSFNSKGGSSVASVTTNYLSDWVQPSNPTKSGYTFAGWTSDSNGLNAFDWTTDAVSNLSLYAKWTLLPITYITSTQSTLSYSNSAVFVDTGLSLDLKGDDRGFTSATVSITSGFSNGDVLSYSDASNTFTTDPVPSYDSATGILSISGSFTQAQWQALFRDVKFNTTSTSTTTRTISFELNQTIPSLVINGKTHYYEVLSASSSNWIDAYTASASKTLYGLDGYLVTVTSDAENTKVTQVASSKSVIWISGSDEGVEGTWKWMSGPETGTTFWTGTAYGSVNGYAKWHTNVQPEGNGDYVIMVTSGGLAGYWGDEASYPVSGYVVEYGGFDSDVAHLTQATRDISFSSSTLTYDANSAVSGSVPSSQSQRQLTSITLPTNSGNLVRTGYTFGGWNTQADGLGTNYTPGSTFTLSSSSHTLYAKWTLNTYTLTFNANSGSSVASQSVNYNAKATEPTVPSRTGYTFGGWYKDSGLNTVFDFTTDVITANQTLYAKWTLNTYSISYTLNGGNNAVSNPSTYTYTSSAITLANPTKDYYNFVGWYSDSSFSTLVTQIPNNSSGNKTLYAKFTPISYSISYSLDGGSASTVSSYTFESAEIILPNPTKTGYTFSHWEDDQENTVTKIDAQSHGDRSFYAIYTLNTYAVSFNSNGGSSVSSQSVNYNSTVSIPSTPTKTGYTFEAWYEDSTLTTAFDFSMSRITAARTLYANWTINSYTLTLNSHGGTFLSSQTKHYNQTFSQPTSPTRSGYVFDGWYTDDGTFAQSYDFSTLVSSNLTLYAKWLITVSYDMNYLGVPAPGSSLVEYGLTYSNLKSVGNVRPGYTLLGWFTSAMGGTEVKNDTLVSNELPHTLYAQWGLSVHLDKQDGSSLVDYGNVKYGSTYAGYGVSALDLPSPTKTGYTFAGWFTQASGGTQVTTSSTVILKDHHTLYAHWTAKNVTVTLSLVNGGDVGQNSQSLSSTYDQTYGSGLVTPSRTEVGKYFTGWWTAQSGGSLMTPTDLVQIESDHTLYAQWGTFSSYLTSYNGNGNTSGTAPTSQSQYTDDSTTISSSGTLVKSGYTFAGWNTQANGSGTQFAPNDSIDTEPKIDRTLYAQWTPKTITVTLKANDGSSTTSTLSVTFDAVYTGLTNVFTRTGYTFNSWLNSLNETITSSSPVINPDNHDLVAQWSPNTYIVTYYASGGTFVSRPAWFTTAIETTSEDVRTSATAIYSRYYGGTPTVSKTGYVFKEWNSTANGSGSIVSGTSIVNTASNHSFYAIWTPSTSTPYTVEHYKEKVTGIGYQLSDTAVYTGTTDGSVSINANSYTGFTALDSSHTMTILPDGTAVTEFYYTRDTRTVSFDSNGGSSVSTQSKKYEQLATEPTSPTRSGYLFAGWYTDDTSFSQAYDFTDPVTSNLTVHAKWLSVPYTISYTLNGGSATTINSYTIETPAITLPTPLKTGYTFVSWHQQADFLDSSVTSIPMGSTGNKALYAQYSVNHYTLDYTLNGGTASLVENYTIEDESLNLPTPVKTGYSFVGWFDNANFTGSSISSVHQGSYGDKTFYAKWTTNSYTLNYVMGGGAASTVSSYTVETPTITLPSPIKSGYNFVGWTDNQGNTVTQLALGSTGNKTFTAHYSPIVYDLHYDLNGGSANTVSSYTIESNSISLPHPTKTGYSFSQWEDDQGNPISTIYQGSIGDRYLIAVFDINSYTVSFNSNGGSSIANDTVLYNSYLSLPSVPTKNGYTFEAWYEDSSFAHEFDFNQSRITHDQTLYAGYTVNTYALNYHLDGGLSTNPSHYEVVDENIELSPAVKTGYRFGGWFDNANFTGSSISSVPQGSYGDKTLYAKFDNALFDILFDTNGGSTMVDETILFGETIPTLPTPRKEGYHFEGWYGDVGLTQIFSQRTMPSRNLNVYAKWTLINYSITYDVQGGSHINPSTYSILDTVSFSPATRTGYVFETWLLNNQEISQIQRGNTGDLTLVARYHLVNRSARFASFSSTSMGADQATFSFSLADEGNPRYNSFSYTLSHETKGVVQTGTVQGVNFSLSGLEAYSNYTLTLSASNGIQTISSSLNFTPRLIDTDHDGIPDVRDLYPKDPVRSYDREKLDPDLKPVRALVAELNSLNEASLKIQPQDLMGTNSSDTILLVMGSTQFVIPVAILDKMIADSLNEETYLSLRVEPQSLNSGIPSDLLDSQNMTLVNAYDYQLMQVDGFGNETQIHQLGGKIKIGVDVNTIIGEYNPENMEVYYYDPLSDTLQVMEAQYDPINHSLVFMTDHFSYYVIGIKKENDPAKTTLQLIFVAISLIIVAVLWFKKNFTLTKK